MNFIRWWTVGLMLFGATMAMTMGVVCLLYFVYIDSAPQLREQFPGLVRMVALFLALGLAGLAAFVPLRRQNRWLWPSQVLLLVSAVAIGVTFWKMLSA